MRFEKAAMLLHLELGHGRFDRLRKAPGDPCRDLHNWHGSRRLEHEQTYNPLHPSHAAFWVRRDNNVLNARTIILPSPAVENPGAVLALSRFDQHRLTLFERQRVLLMSDLMTTSAYL